MLPVKSTHRGSWLITFLGLISLSARAITILPSVFPAIAVVEELTYREADKAPPSWARFGKLVKDRFEEWISADDAIANRFRAYVTEHAGKDDAVPQALVVHVWLRSEGTVERVSFNPLSDLSADGDLRTILTRGNLGEKPPPDMLQPLNLRLSFNLKKAPGSEPGKHSP